MKAVDQSTKHPHLRIGQVYFIPARVDWDSAYVYLITNILTDDVVYNVVTLKNDLLNIKHIQQNVHYDNRSFLNELPTPSLVKDKKLKQFIKLVCV